MKESATLELNQSITKTFLKTISAFSNYDGGTIIFGIDDSGRVIGIDNIDDARLDIENRINDNIKPQPRYEICTNEDEKTIQLTIYEGNQKPYFCNSKAYKRNDTSTIEVDTTELTRLILEGRNQTYEQLPAQNQNLSFTYLKQAFEQIVHLSSFDQDTLITLNLLNTKTGYNIAGLLLSDNNDYPGIDISVFGDNINIIKQRNILSGQSILKSYFDAVDAYKYEYQYEQIKGTLRSRVELIPEEAFREALANAVTHRLWDIPAHIRVAFMKDHISITSPGGLHKDLKIEEYLNGKISMLRNPILANVFYRLGIIEMYGTGIKRINDAYQNSLKKPIFEVSENLIEINLPVIETNTELTADQQKIYKILSKSLPLSISQILEKTSLKKSKTRSILNQLIEAGVITKTGQGKATKYKLN